jgi:hypothetical protein
LLLLLTFAALLICFSCTRDNAQLCDPRAASSSSAAAAAAAGLAMQHQAAALEWMSGAGSVKDPKLKVAVRRWCRPLSDPLLLLLLRRRRLLLLLLLLLPSAAQRATLWILLAAIGSLAAVPLAGSDRM